MKPKRTKTVARVTSFLMAITGVLLLAAVLYPIFSYNAQSERNFPDFLSPIPDVAVSVDLTDAKNWFPTANADNAFPGAVSYYNISVPKLGIKDAVVSLGGEDLSDSLIQYPGTAVPGKVGNTVVFGHSVLPAFYDPKVYLTIFSKLPTLKKDDLIEVNYDGISYEYRVSDMQEVLPTNLSVLSQPKDNTTLSLVTCVPPGDPRRPRRLIVKATLVPPSERNLYDNTRI